MTYSRVYWSIMDDPKFDGVRENPRHLGSWCLLLIVADMAWPAPAFLPPTVPPASIAALTTAGIIDRLSGGRFRVHGLDKERSRRADAARVGGFASGRSRTVERSLNGRSTESSKRSTESNLAEPSRDKPSLRAPAREGPKDPLREAQRAAYGELYGNGSDDPVVQAIVIETPEHREREALRLEALALHERYKRGEFGPAEYERLRADLGKQPDDLTRAERTQEVEA